MLIAVFPGTKFVPVSATRKELPCAKFCGLGTADSVGGPGAAFTVKGTVPLVPVEVLTLTLWAPSGALVAMANVAVMVVLFTTLTPLTVIPLPLRLIVAPETKFVPVRVTPMIAPCTLLEGLTEPSVGAGCGVLTVKLTLPLVPLEVVTLTLWVPSGAFAATVKVAVTWVAADGTLGTGMPFSALIVAPERFLPVRVTVLMVWPCWPLDGLIVLSVGADVAAGQLFTRLAALTVPMPVAKSQPRVVP